MEHSKPILEFKHIVKEFPGVRALDDVSMDFYEGEVVALMGENGAGKSTLMKFKRCLYAGWRGHRPGRTSPSQTVFHPGGQGIRCGYHLPGIKPYVRDECHGKCICVP